MGMQRNQNSKILKKKKVEKISFSNFKTYYIVVAVKPEDIGGETDTLIFGTEYKTQKQVCAGITD